MSPAKAAAVKLISKYADWKLEALREHMGSSVPGGMSVSIGGYQPVGGKYYSCDWILVDRDINGRVCQERFKLKEIYELCQSGQQALL